MYIYEVAKSLGFSFGLTKNKTKPKALASCADGNEKFPYYRTTLSPTVSHKLKKHPAMEELLFSYGTLQLKKVQLESFARELNGEKDILTGYKLEQLQITDKTVLERSEQEFHPIAVPSKAPNDKVKGTLFKISIEELKQADLYEVADYKRVKATFQSGKQGWVYVKS